MMDSHKKASSNCYGALGGWEAHLARGRGGRGALRCEGGCPSPGRQLLLQLLLLPLSCALSCLSLTLLLPPPVLLHYKVMSRVLMFMECCLRMTL